MKKKVLFTIFSSLLLLSSLFVISKVIEVKAEDDIEDIPTFSIIFNEDAISSGTLETGNYYLNDNTTITKHIVIKSGSEVAININGYELTSTNREGLFEIEEGAKLDVYDTGEELRYFEDNGSIFVETSENTFNYINGGYLHQIQGDVGLFDNRGTLNLYGINLVGSNEVSYVIKNGIYDSSAVNYIPTGNATINNCMIMGNNSYYTINNCSNMEIKNTLITNNKASRDIIKNYAELVIDNTYIESNISSYSLIDIEEGNALITNSSYVVNNEINDFDSAAIYVRQDATLTLGDNTFIRSNFASRQNYSSLFERNVLLKTNNLYLEEDEEGNVDLGESFMVGITLAIPEYYPIKDVEGLITGKSYKTNVSNYFFGDNNDYIINGYYDEESDGYDLYQELLVESNPTEENPIFNLNLDDNKEVMYQWYSTTYDYNLYSYLDGQTEISSGVTYLDEPGNFKFNMATSYHYIKFDGDCGSNLSFNILANENITNVKVDVYKNNDYSAIDTQYLDLSEDAYCSFYLYEFGRYRLDIKCIDNSQINNDIYIEDACIYNLVPDYENPLEEETNNILESVNMLAGNYICEAIVNNMCIYSSILTLDSKIVKQPTIDDPSVEVATVDEFVEVSYQWYFYDYTYPTTRIIMYNDFDFVNGVEAYDDITFRYDYGCSTNIELTKKDTISFTVNHDYGFNKDNCIGYRVEIYIIYNTGRVGYYKGYSTEDIDEEISIKIEEDATYKIFVNPVFKESVYESEEEIDTFVDVNIVVSQSGYSLGNELVDETTNTLSEEYNVGAYICKVTFDDVEIFTDPIEFTKLYIANNPTETNPTFEISDNRFEYQWYKYNNANGEFEIVEKCNDKTLSNYLEAFGSYICVASYQNILIESNIVKFASRIISQPTKENPVVVVGSEENEIFYQWYYAYYNEAKHSWMPGNYIDDEITNELCGYYPVGDYICRVIIHDNQRTELLSDVVHMGDIEIKAPTIENPTIIVNNGSVEKEIIEWYEYQQFSFDNHEVTDDDQYDFFGYDEYCAGIYEDNKWKLSKEACDEGYALFKITLPSHSKITLNISSDEAYYYEIYFFDEYDNDYCYEVEEMYTSYSFEYVFEYGTDWCYVLITAQDINKEEYKDVYVNAYVDFNEYGYVLMEDETTNTLSNKDSRVGYYCCYVTIGDYYACYYLYFEERILEEPSIDNDYSIEVLTSYDVIYDWYIYELIDNTLIDDELIDSENIYCKGYEDGKWIVEVNPHDSYYPIDYCLFDIYIEEGQLLTFKAASIDSEYVGLLIFNDENDEVYRRYEEFEINDEYRFLNSGIYYFVLIVDNDYDLASGFFVGSLTTEVYELISSGENNKLNTIGLDDIYDYICIVHDEDYEIEIKSKVFNICNHDYEIEYIWNEDYSEVVAKAICSKDGHEIIETCAATCNVVDEATCLEDGKKVYKVEFTNHLFETQTYAKNIPILEHEFSELIEGQAATCLEDGIKSHYHCSLCNKDYDTNHHELDSLVIPALGHNLTKIEAKLATTSEEGNIEYYVCSNCGKFFKDAKGKEEITIEQIKLDKIQQVVVDVSGCKGNSKAPAIVPILLITYLIIRKKRKNRISK